MTKYAPTTIEKYRGCELRVSSFTANVDAWSLPGSGKRVRMFQVRGHANVATRLAVARARIDHMFDAGVERQMSSSENAGKDT